MKINVKRLLDIDGEKLGLDCDIDLSSFQRLEKEVIPEKVHLAINLVNRATVLTLEYKASFVQRCVCDRCLKEELSKQEMCFSHTLVRSLNGTAEDGYLLVPDDTLDMAEVAADDIRLEMPTGYLCDDDCKGLCPQCGADLNCKQCGCVTKTIDPRLEVLKKLL